ncbi:MAG: 4'-phosphopantetheinyl transferase superfamily protein [Litoreibacter sp.]
MFEIADIKQRIQLELTKGHGVVFADELGRLQQFDPDLTQTEQQKFDRVRIADQRRLHALGRGLVRYLLDLPSGDFCTGQSGKPYAPDAPSFNISHAGQMIVVALHAQLPVGVDIETQTRHIHDGGLIKRVCHQEEAHWIAQQDERSQALAFLRCWVRKEAVLKAMGTGLIDALHTINTNLQETSPVLSAPCDLRLWDFPEMFSSDPGTLAIDPRVKRVTFLSTSMVTTMMQPEQNTPAQATLESYETHHENRN